jgi:hypothetical protein
MSQADKDAEKWMQDNAKWQKRKLIEAKERGFTHWINQHGDVVAVKEDKNEPKAR